MKSFITTIKNIWKIKELRERILFTLLILLVYRFGTYVLLPGVDRIALEASTSNSAPTDIL
ncbi:MAG TPA: hypothetical protein VKZ56_04740, partial [Membranihabitans sp.]|nr:hypothetical protein [Membranihabitans sp.]